MSTEYVTTDEIRERFVVIANELNFRFPELDLRFNIQEDSTLLRFMAAAISPDVIEMDIADDRVEDLIHAAIFQVKELAQIFDA